MARRRRRGNPVHGWVAVDKPAGMTSVRVVAAVRRIFDAARCGHAGTLDPIATGVLPVALGEATKTVPYLMDRRKEYRFDVTWGAETSTDDSEGEVIARSDRRPERTAILGALPGFVGEIEQVPPRYSAIKVQGRRAYALAREGQAVELPARPVRIDAFTLLAEEPPDGARFHVVSGKGAYMRALARDLARALGTVGHLSRLRRLRVGPFCESGAISLESLEALAHSPAAFEHLSPVETALDDIPALALTETEAGMMRRGQPVPVYRPADRERMADLREGDLLSARAAGTLVAIARVEGGCACPVRVLNL